MDVINIDYNNKESRRLIITTYYNVYDISSNTKTLSSMFVKKQFACLKYLAAHWVEYLAQQTRVIKIAVWHLPRFQSSKLSYVIIAECYDPGNILMWLLCLKMISPASRQDAQLPYFKTYYMIYDEIFMLSIHNENWPEKFKPINKSMEEFTFKHVNSITQSWYK